MNKYDPDWIKTVLPGESKPLDALLALKTARTTSTSPCANE